MAQTAEQTAVQKEKISAQDRIFLLIVMISSLLTAYIVIVGMLALIYILTNPFIALLTAIATIPLMIKVIDWLHDRWKAVIKEELWK